MADIKKILEGLLSSDETVEKISLGQGVVGKSTYTALATLIVLGIIAYQGTEELLFPVLYATIGLFCLYFIGILAFAFWNPGPALLEGAELLRWRKQELAAKNLPNPPRTVAITDQTPKLSPPEGS